MTETKARYDQRYTLTPAQASDLSAQVLAILADHRGAAQAITGQTLARTLGHRNDRAVRLAIGKLIEAGQPVAASVNEPVGYYLIATPEEAHIYEAVLRSRAVKTLRRLQQFHKAAGQAFGPSFQLPLPTFAISQTIKGLER